MTVLGIDLGKGQLRYSVLEGTKAKPRLVKKERLPVPEKASTPELMSWFDNTFKMLISRHNPSKIAYRLLTGPLKKQIFYLTYPYAILNFICHEKKLPIKDYVAANFVSSKLGLSKSKNIYDYCEKVFDLKPSSNSQNKNQKYSLLAAWLELN